MTGLSPGRRVHQSINAIRQHEVTTQCSVPSAESYGALPAEASPLVSRETSPSPRETAVMPPTPVRQRTLSLSDCHASPTDGTRSVPPKRMYLPRSSAAAVRRIPSGTTYSTGDRYRTLGGGIKLLLTCYGICPTCLREGRGHHVSASSLESRLQRLGDVCRRLTKHCRRTLHHWFHVKPTHEHGVGVMAERRRHPRGLHSQDR